MKKLLIIIFTIILISVGLFYVFLKTNIEFTIIETDKSGNISKFYVVRNKKLFTDVVEIGKFNDIEQTKIIRNFQKDTICLSSGYFNTRKGSMGNVQFCCPSILIDSLSYTDFGFKSRLQLKDNNSHRNLGELYYEITEGVFGSENLERFYLEKLKGSLNDRLGEYDILYESIDDNYVNVTILYGKEDLRVSRNKVIKDGDLIYNVEFSCPYIFYVTYSDFISSLFIQTGLKDQINLLNLPSSEFRQGGGL